MWQVVVRMRIALEGIRRCFSINSCKSELVLSTSVLCLVLSVILF